MKINSDPFQVSDHSVYRFTESSLPMERAKNREIDTLSSAAPPKTSILEEKGSQKASVFDRFIHWISNLFNGNKTEKSQKEEQSHLDPSNRPSQSDPLDKIVREMEEINKRTEEIDEAFDSQRQKEQLETLLKKLKELQNDNPYRALAVLLRLLILLQKGQGELREEDTLFLKDEVQRKQGDVKRLQVEKTRIHEQIEKIGKKSAVFGKISTALTGASLAITGTALVFAAASLATLGISGIISIGIHALGGVVTGLKAINTLFQGLTEKEMKKTEKKSLEVIESKKMVQYTLKMNLQDLEKDMKELTRLNEAISQIIRTEYDAGRMH